MPLPNIPQTEALVPLAASPVEPFPDQVPAELLLGLSLREQRFLLGYLEHGNAARAYEHAIMKAEPTHPNSTAANGWQYLRRPKMQAALNRIQAFFAYHMGLHAWQILGKLHQQAMLDPIEIYDGDGANWTMKPMQEWPAAIRQCVQRVTIKEWETKSGVPGRQVDVEFTDRQQALFLLGKHLKLYEKKDRQVAPFTLVLNTTPPDASELKRVGEVIEGIGLHITMPEVDLTLEPPRCNRFPRHTPGPRPAAGHSAR
jgi:Terminase small subunit